MTTVLRRPVIHSSRQVSQSWATVKPQRQRLIQQKRLASSDSVASTSFASIPPSPPRRPLVRTTFLALTLLGIATTGAGLYAYYNTFSTWPDEIRGDLRTALKAQRRGDKKRAEAAYRSALNTAQSLSQEKLGSNPLLKVTGISIAFGSFLEEEGRLEEAYRVYVNALDHTREMASQPEEKMRAIALAQKCGDLARIQEVSSALKEEKVFLSDTTSLAEDHLRWSVEELLRLAIPDAEREKIISTSSDGAVLLADLELPPWISGSTLGASLEALGQLYASQGRSEYAIPLYIQSINMLMPANKASRKRDPTVAERCRTGIFMNNVAQLLVDADKSSPKVEEATSWALKGLDIVGYALRGAGWDGRAGQEFKTVEGSGDEKRTNEVKGICFTAEVALLINLAELARIKKDDCKARELFQRVYVKADTYGMRDARSRAAQALSELERSLKGNKVINAV